MFLGSFSLALVSATLLVLSVKIISRNYQISDFHWLPMWVVSFIISINIIFVGLLVALY